MHKLFSLLLSPLSLLYGIGDSIYQSLYWTRLIKPVRFSFPVISIGNLSVGGTGKSPHIEYLIRLLKNHVELGVLSRGYKRNTMGFMLVDENHDAKQVGDEPKQIHSKFPDVPVAVSESRVTGIPRMIRNFPDLKLILLDDAFQHLAVKPSLNILLTEYARPYTRDFLLPSGRLREWRFGAARANAVIVTKCPGNLTDTDFESWRSKLILRDHQQLFFSKVEYGIPYHIFKPESRYLLNPGLHVFLISAIAQSGYLFDHLSDQVAVINETNFEDHHYFTEMELQALIAKFESVSHTNKMILTTEKDATRLALFREFFEKRNIDVYAIPIEVKFYQGDRFDNYIRNFLLEFKI
ncbi:MAG TPA: tetraacyldisaccharide 4'-kinase [Saprospiraceae bacterium]|nr:tetraacyldisaccharide 4'-kinase [Saprospiraceae bacterium]